jgi:hypothetical protein
MEKIRDVRVELVGGLGNQLFGYFAGLYLQQSFESSITLDFSQIRTIGHLNSDLRLFDLAPHRSIDSYSYESKVRTLIRRVRDKSIIISPNLSKFIYPTTSVIGDDCNLLVIGDNRNINNERDKLKSKILLRGYFGNFEYFEQLDTSKKLLELARPRPAFRRAYSIAKTRRPIVVHVRRGDYVSHKNIYGLLSETYYENAINEAKSLVGNQPIWVFSDDLNFAENMFIRLGVKVTFLEREYQLNPAEVMLLQSVGSANIIANSTFSAWGAALNIESTVKICPSKYFADNRLTPHWPPKGWNFIEPDWQ